MTVGEAIKEQKDFIARKYHIFRSPNARLKESMKVLTKAYSDLWEYLEHEHGDIINTEIRKNYIPKLLVEEILEECKKQKEENKDRVRDIFYQGCIYTCEAILKKESK